MKILSTWKGSPDPLILSGVAEFKMMGESFTMNLESFADFHVINRLCRHYQSVGFESCQLVAIQQLRNIKEMK